MRLFTTHIRKENDPIMKYLDASTDEKANKIFKGWTRMKREFGPWSRIKSLGLS